MNSKSALFSLLFLCTNSQAEIGAPITGYQADKIADEAWVIHGPLGLPSVKNQGFMNNPGYVMTDKGVVIIDPGSSVQVGEMVLRVLKTISDKPVIAVFNSHIHGDHWLGNQAIRKAYPDAKIYGHPKMIQAIKDGDGDTWVKLMDKLTDGATKGTGITPPTTAVDHGDSFTIGNKTFKIHHYGHAHTHTDIMVEIVEDKIVFLGDNVLADRLPRMSDGNFKGAMNSINEILKTDATVWVPGHGKTNGRSMLKDFHDYLSHVYITAKKVFEKDLDSSDVKALLLKETERYNKWSGYDDEIGKHGAQAFMEVEASEF